LAEKQKVFSFSKFLFFAAIILILVISIIIIKAPAILSSGKGKDFLLGAINRKIPGSINIESLNLSWKSGLEITGFSLKDGETSIVFGSLKTELSLLDLISVKKLDFGKTQMRDIYVKIYLDGIKELPGKEVTAVKSHEQEKVSGQFIILPRSFSGEIEIENANIMISGPDIKPARFTEISVKLFSKPGRKIFSFSTRGKASQDKLSGFFDVKGRLENLKDIMDFDLSSAKAEINATLKSVPTEGIDFLLKTDGLFEAAFGSNLNLETSVLTGAGTANVSFKADSPDFSADFTMELTDESIRLLKEANIKCSVSPVLFKKIVKTAPFRLKNKTGVEATITKLEVPLRGRAGNPLSILYAAKLNAEIRASKLSLAGVNDKYTLTLDPLRLAVSGEQLGKKTIIKADCRLSGPGSLDKGEISFDGVANNILKPEGLFNKEGFSIKFNSGIDGVSVKELDRLFDTDRFLATVMGETLNIKASAELQDMKGPVNLSIEGLNANAVIPAYLNEGYLSLHDNIRAEIKVTPDLGRIILKNINPLLITAVSAKKPISVNISRDEFYLPLKNFSISNVTVKEAVVELGEITLDNGGILSPLVAFLKSTSGQAMTASFTPLRASLRKGTARYSRMDTILANSFHTVTWGTIDISNDKLDIILGLPSDTLDKVFDLEDLPEDYILEIPIRGSTANPKVDWSKAAAKIGTLFLKKKIDEEVPGLGTAIDGLFNKSGKDDNSEDNSPGSILIDSLNKWLENQD
jgi:hypothetical protein